MYQLGLSLEQNGHKELRNQLKNVKKSFKAEMTMYTGRITSIKFIM
jgi:hypothetical protein